MLKPGELVRIDYIRPGKKTTQYEEALVALDDVCLRTFKRLPNEITERLSQALREQNMIAPHQRAVTIAKTYFFTQPFDLLEFRDADGSLLGYYSDVGEPLTQIGESKFQMIDLYLDIWLYPNGRLLELDWDEFETAIQKEIISTSQAELARAAMLRLVREVSEGIYPSQYLK